MLKRFVGYDADISLVFSWVACRDWILFSFMTLHADIVGRVVYHTKDRASTVFGEKERYGGRH